MDYPQRAAFRMLDELQRRFEDVFGAELATASALALSKPASALLADLARRHSDIATVDKVAAVAVQVDQVKGVMQSNINAVLKVRFACALRMSPRYSGADVGSRIKTTWKLCSLMLVLCAMRRAPFSAPHSVQRIGCGGRIVSLWSPSSCLSFCLVASFSHPSSSTRRLPCEGASLRNFASSSLC